MGTGRRGGYVIAAAMAAAMFGFAGAASAQDSNALWEIVHGQCVSERQHHRALTAPCVTVNLAGRYSVIKDRRGATQYLLIPNDRIAGIESPTLLTRHAVNYFAKAWQARSLVEKALGRPLPSDMLSLAINSELARSQSQLHIHIDCVRVDVRDALADAAAKLGPHWAPFDVWFFGHHYSAMKVAGTTLDWHNPFELLAHGAPGAAADMGRYTLVVVGMRFAGHVPGFVVLADHADPAHGDNAGGEELQDHACALGHQAR